MYVGIIVLGGAEGLKFEDLRYVPPPPVFHLPGDFLLPTPNWLTSLNERVSPISSAFPFMAPLSQGMASHNVH